MFIEITIVDYIENEKYIINANTIVAIRKEWQGKYIDKGGKTHIYMKNEFEFSCKETMDEIKKMLCVK